MQVTPPQAPILPGVLPQDAATRVMPQVQAQAAAPLLQRAVDPSSKSERGHQSRSNGDRAKGGGNDGKRGASVNIRV